MLSFEGKKKQVHVLLYLFIYIYFYYGVQAKQNLLQIKNFQKSEWVSH